MSSAERCKEEVAGEGQWGAFHMHQCRRMVWDEHPADGFCKQHHPLSVAARNEKAKARWDADVEQRQKAHDAPHKLEQANQHIAVLKAQRDELIEAAKAALCCLGTVCDRFEIDCDAGTNKAEEALKAALTKAGAL